MQLFCFTYAGGTAEFYDMFNNKLNKDIEVVAFDYAGSGKRFKEPFYKDFDELSNDMYEKVKDNLNGDYFLFGYSMGSLVLAKVLELIINKKEIPLPKCVFLNAHEPKPKSEIRDIKGDELDEIIKKHTLKFGGIPKELIKNKSFWRMYLPIYRSHFTLLHNFDFKFNFKTSVPAVICYSESDIKREDILLWNNFFIGTVEYNGLMGNHFFIKDHTQFICDLINTKLIEV